MPADLPAPDLLSADARLRVDRPAMHEALVFAFAAGASQEVFDDAIAKAWALANQTGEPKVQLPGKDREFGLRELMRGMFEGAAQGVTQGVSQGVRGGVGGIQFLAPELVR
jgi:hypothetical protein